MMVGELKVNLKNAKVVGHDIPSEVYFRQQLGNKRGDPHWVMSRGELMEFNRCPQRWLMGYESGETKATEWGSLIDTLALSPDKFKDRFAVTPEMYPCEPTKKDPRTEKPWNANANYCAEWEEGQIGKAIVKPKKLTEAQNAIKFLFGNPQIADLINCSRRQVMVMAEYEDAETGLVVPLKCLLDLVPALASPFEKCLGDLKTATSAALFPWTRAVNEHSYHVQAAMYLDIYCATGEDRTDWLHAVQESYPPWQTATWLLSAEFVEIGRMKYLNALKRYCLCLRDNHWPGYSGARVDWNGWGIVDPEPFMVA